MTTEFGGAPTLRSYIVLVRRRKWWIAVAAILGLAVSLGLALSQAKQYSATAQILVQPSGASTALGGGQAAVTPTDVQTDLQLVTSAPVQAQVARQLGSEPSISATEVAQTNVIAITAISASPAQAALIANTYAKAFVAYQGNAALAELGTAEAQVRAEVRSLGRQITALKAATADSATQISALVNQQAVLRQQLAQMQVSGAVGSGLELVTPAVAPTSPSSPKPKEDAALGLAAGLILGLGAAFLRDSLDDTLSSKDTAEQLSGAPVLTMVPMVASWKRRDQPLVISVSHPLSPAAEAYRSLRTSLQFARQERELRTLVVTSPAAAEGKTSTIANLGAVFAQAGERVVVVSCDLRKPRIGQFFGLGEQYGLTTVLLGEQPLADVLQPVSGFETLWLLGAGPLPSNPAELLTGAASREVFAALRAEFDLVLIDSPPVLPVTDAAILSKDADGTLLVVAAGQTKRVDVRRAAEKLAQVNAPLLGTVLNEVTRQVGYGYGGGYGSGYGYGYAALDPSAELARVPLPASGSPPLNGSASYDGGASQNGQGPGNGSEAANGTARVNGSGPAARHGRSRIRNW